MILKSFELNKISENTIFHLLYGKNEGLKTECINEILKKNDGKVFNYDENQIKDQTESFYENLLSGSLFENTKIILINRASLDVMNNPALKGLVNEKGHMRVKDIEKVVRTPGVKTRCPIMYQGEDIVKVERGGITLSALRKLEK